LIVSTLVPPLLAGLTDDAAVFPPGSATLPDALASHRAHRTAWYAPIVGPLLVPADDLAALGKLLRPDESVEVGLIGSREAVLRSLGDLPARATVRQVEVPVAKRGEDPMPGLRAFLRDVTGHTAYAEIPLTAGLLSALDEVAAARAAGAPVAPKFRTGGLAAELFPTPVELAGVICACRDRDLPFKLTAGLHHAIRHTDRETGLTHHGFLNVLVAACVAAEGAAPGAVAQVLAGTDPLPLVEGARARLREDRPLWIGFGTCSILEPLADLRTLGLLGFAA
jgi:hypothetical protein